MDAHLRFALGTTDISHCRPTLELAQENHSPPGTMTTQAVKLQDCIISTLQEHLTITQVDKSSANFSAVCKGYYRWSLTRRILGGSDFAPVHAPTPEHKALVWQEISSEGVQSRCVDNRRIEIEPRR